MTPGRIVLVDWRDALPGSTEPSKIRPGIVVGSSFLFSRGSPTRIVVPLTGSSTLAIPGASLEICPTEQNFCTKTCYALAWNVQSVPSARLHEARGRVTDDELALVRALVARCVDAAAVD
jgi:mRNA-degrading endonuclease toxin of MazEF toxin-antitoxin module